MRPVTLGRLRPALPWYTSRDREAGDRWGLRAASGTRAFLPALTSNSGMRYRKNFRLSRGCPPDGTLSRYSVQVDRIGFKGRFCQAVRLTA